jgi:hypothetical protein
MRVSLVTQYLQYVDYVSTGLFTLEAVIKIVALGFVLHPTVSMIVPLVPGLAPNGSLCLVFGFFAEFSLFLPLYLWGMPGHCPSARACPAAACI